MPKATLIALLTMLATFAYVDAGPTSPPTGAARRAKPSLAKANAALRVPPAWMASTQLDASTTELAAPTTQPWKPVGKKMLDLLKAGDQSSRRQAIKLVYTHKQAGAEVAINQFGLILFWGGEPAWALRELTATLAEAEAAKRRDLMRRYMSIVSCYRHFGEYAKAVEVVKRGLAHVAKPPRGGPAKALLNAQLGDLYVDTGRTTLARKHYTLAVKFSTPPAGAPARRRRVMLWQVQKHQAKLAHLDAPQVKDVMLTDGAHQGVARGYAGAIKATVTVAGGRVTKIDLDHTESMANVAPTVLPQRIIAEQSLRVDGVTGATGTSDGIRAAAFDALTKAGLRAKTP